MSDLLGYSLMENLVFLLIGGGGILFLFGLCQIISCTPHTDMRGRRRPKPLAPLGVSLCTLGLILGFSWHII